jgi:hypothetical protein
MIDLRASNKLARYSLMCVYKKCAFHVFNTGVKYINAHIAYIIYMCQNLVAYILLECHKYGCQNLPHHGSQPFKLEKSRGPSWGKNAHCPSNLRQQGATLSYQVKKGWDNPNYLEQKKFDTKFEMNRQTISIQIFSHGVPSFKTVFIRNTQSCLWPSTYFLMSHIAFWDEEVHTDSFSISGDCISCSPTSRAWTAS